MAPRVNTMSVAAPSPVQPSTSPVNPASTERTIASRVLGEVVVPSVNFVTLPEGLHGFAEYKEFALVPAAREGFFWMQSADEPQLAFLLVDPFLVLPGYEIDLSAAEELRLGLSSPDEALVLAVVTLPLKKQDLATANLRGPVVFNVATRIGHQVVSAADSYSVHHSFPIQ